jgi:acyl-coenzyme A synthetase/AMP-(fatty) acid ligase
VPVDPSDPEDLAILGYTSGTTGFLKGDQPPGDRQLHPTDPVRVPARPQSRCAFTGSLSFVSTIWTILLPHLYLGGKITFMGAYDPDLWWKKMEIERTTFTYAPTPLVPQL